MDFKEIRNLKQEDIINLYDDIMEVGDDMRLTGCCCYEDDWPVGTSGFYSRAACDLWCRGSGYSCRGWASNTAAFGATGCFFGC